MNFGNKVGLWGLSLCSAGLARAEGPYFHYGIYGNLGLERQDVYKNAQDFTPRHRWTTDLEGLTFEPEISFSPNLELEAEVEFEHGGTGSSLEFDGFNEGGEFENEVERGGAAEIEKLQLLYKAQSWFNVHGGLIAVPVGWSSSRELPSEYFTVRHDPTESHIIPQSWREVGLGVTGELGSWVYEYDFLTALNSEFFRKYNWVAKSSDRRFETPYADSWAHAFRLDYGFARDHRVVGMSVYYGDSGGNRAQTGKLDVPANILIADLHALFTWQAVKLRALYLRGYLQNAALVGQANSSLGGAVKTSAPSVGRESEAAYVEGSYNIATLWSSSRAVDAFIRWDHWDSMKSAADGGLRDPRLRQSRWGLGLNAYLAPEVVLKVQYSRAQSGLDGIPVDHQISLGLGFSYFPKQGDDNDVLL